MALVLNGTTGVSAIKDGTVTTAEKVLAQMLEFSNGWELGWKSDAHKGNHDNYSLVFLGWK